MWLLVSDLFYCLVDFRFCYKFFRRPYGCIFLLLHVYTVWTVYTCSSTCILWSINIHMPSGNKHTTAPGQQHQSTQQPRGNSIKVHNSPGATASKYTTAPGQQHQSTQQPRGNSIKVHNSPGATASKYTTAPGQQHQSTQQPRGNSIKVLVFICIISHSIVTYI